MQLITRASVRRWVFVVVGVAVAAVLSFAVTAGQASAVTTTTGTIVGTNQYTFGSPTPTTLACPVGSMLTGFLVGNSSAVGGYPEDLALQCTWPGGSTTTIGTTSDSFEATAACPTGEQGAGVYGRTGAIIDRIGIRCTVPGSGVVTDGGLSPGADTSPASFDCPSGLVLTGVTFTKIGYEFDGNEVVNTVTGLCGNPNPCTTTITGTHGSLTLTSGTTCVIGATISGGITVTHGASLYLENSTVTGGISAGKPGNLSICGSTLGSLAVTGASGPVVIGDSPANGCTANTFNGSVNLSGNRGGVTVVDNQITGSLLVTANAAPVVVSGNHK